MIDARVSGAGDLAGAEEFFDADYYRARYPDTVVMDAWSHFVRHGDGERRSPGPAFDSEFYAATYLGLDERHPLRHFLQRGRDAGFLPLPRAVSAQQSRAAMAQALTGRGSPVLLVGNDARRAGAPLLLLEVARHLRRRGMDPIFLLHQAGPLLDAHRAIGPTLILAEGFDVAALGDALPTEVPVLGQTGVVAPVLAELAHRGPQALLVHEMPDYLEQRGLLPAVERARVVVAALPGVGEGLRARLPDVDIRTITMGLLHRVTGEASERRVGALLRREFGPERIVVLGAGFADERKGFDRFLAFAHLMHAAEPRTAFVWLGEAGSWGAGLADAARADGLPLLMAGFRVDAEAFYGNADLYLLTSRQDPGPTTVIDAARRGVPFVAAPGDIGLRSLGDLLESIGEFLDDDAEVPGRALELIAGDTPELRAVRARRVEGHGDFSRYVDDLLEVLGVGVSSHPASAPAAVEP